MKSIPAAKPEMRTLDAAQADALLAATADHPLHIGWRLALMGLRRGEVLALRWANVDFDAGTLAITASRVATAGAATTGAPKTATSVRTLPLPPDLATALRRAKRMQAEAKLALGPKWSESGYVVVDEFGNPPYPDTLTVAWRTALAGAGLPHVRLHDARHSCATLMHMRGYRSP